MGSNVLGCVGIDISTIKGEKNIASTIAGARRASLLQGLFNLFNLCEAGTDIEIRIDFEHADQLALQLKIDEGSSAMIESGSIDAIID